MDTLYKLIVVTARVAFWSSVIIVFLVMMTLIISLVTITLNGTVIMDLYYLVQLWLPFNLSVVFTWIITLILAYFAYRVALWALTLFNELVRN